MGKLVLVLRLAARDVRHHVAQAVLLVVAIAAAAATLTMALALSGVTGHPYQQTRAVTKGPDVVAYITSPSDATEPDPRGRRRRLQRPLPDCRRPVSRRAAAAPTPSWKVEARHRPPSTSRR